ncbi:MAG: NnrU family protein [Bdellovibrio bacteriovorus]
MGPLILGLVIFLGVHSLGMAAPAWRERTIARLGEVPWKGLYSVASLVGFVLIVWGYGLARQEPVALWVPPTWLRHVALLVMLPAFPLLLAAYLPGRIQTAAKHPMLAAVKLWAFAHLLANGNLADVILFGSFLAWAVADRISLRGRTPPPVHMAPPGKANDAIAVIGGLILYGAFIGIVHAWLFGVSPLGVR